eukprot:366485-Chlamydomonas_euryale.AAC.27
MTPDKTLDPKAQTWATARAPKFMQLLDAARLTRLGDVSGCHVGPWLSSKCLLAGWLGSAQEHDDRFPHGGTGHWQLFARRSLLVWLVSDNMWLHRVAQLSHHLTAEVLPILGPLPVTGDVEPQPVKLYQLVNDWQGEYNLEQKAGCTRNPHGVSRMVEAAEGEAIIHTRFGLTHPFGHFDN